MKDKKNSNIVKIVKYAILLFIIYNMIWLLNVLVRYKPYTKGFETFEKNKSYYSVGKNGYVYNVKYPNYLSFTGNMAISKDNDRIGLIIWPKIFGNFDLGLQINEDNEIYSYILDAKRKDYNKSIIEKNRDDIEDLKKKAENKFNIDLQ
ncbi:MAG: hypothetical protein PUG67_06080 [Peptoniphilaceae bacterium]|nr:hypothetical protein [Peptoniphilaceae bacterium]MDY6019462.1 hypothetical protein [Anaerococcus sp.]